MTEIKTGLVKGLGTLVEGELERAEIVLATKDLVDRLQRIIEDLGKMGTDDIMPLVDGLRTYYGPQFAESFSRVSEQNIQTAADAIQAMKDAIDNERIRFEDRISDEDANTPVNDMTSMDNGQGGMDSRSLDDELDALDDMGNDDDVVDVLGGADQNANAEPLGRARKEGKVVKLYGHNIRLSEIQIRAIQTTSNLATRIKELIETSRYEQTVIISLNGIKIKLTEHQIKSLIFAKQFNKIVESKKARRIQVNASQKFMIETAKHITSKINSILSAQNR